VMVDETASLDGKSFLANLEKMLAVPSCKFTLCGETSLLALNIRSWCEAGPGGSQ
jgi:hypothetical protein